MKRPLRLAFVLLGSLTLVAGLALGTAILYATRHLEQRHDVPLPAAFAPARSPEALARGQHLFELICAQCHGNEQGVAAGKHMADVPPWLGTFWTANITRHPEGGVGAWSDAEIARLLRTGVKRDGRLAAVMPVFPNLSDDDLAAVVGFMRSDDPMFAPVAERPPRVSLTVAGHLILTFVAGTEVKQPPAGPVVAPPAGVSADHGRYLVKDVLLCGDCHSPGFAGDKSEGKEAFTGGFEFVDARGQPIFSSNLTPDAETGLGKVSEDEFVRTLRFGVRPDGTIIHPPMPPFRGLSDDEARAIYAFLRTLPPVHHPIPRAAPEAAPAGDGVQARFVSLGCVACHGEGAAFREKLRPAADHSVEEVAQRILHPEAFNPRSLMPTFAGRIDEPQALALAEYVREEARRLPAPPATPAVR